jgi:outer membrane protein assembly factor BamB
MTLRTWIGAALGVLVAFTASADDWPGWRGPTHQGVSAEKNLPTRWSATENIAWKTAVPGVGWSSPIVFGDRVFLTAASDDGVQCRVICLDRADGKILWNTEVFQQSVDNKAGRNSYATPTPATDGKRVYAVFCDGSFAALDYQGNVVWTNRRQKFYSQHGLGASPILLDDLLLMPWDGSSKGPDRRVGWQTPWENGALLALDTATGEIRWRGSRGPSRIAHVVPSVLRAGGAAQIVSGAGDVVQGFDPADGRRLWSVRSEGEGVVPSIVVGGGLVFSASDDPASAQIVWESKRAVPAVPSFLYADGLLFAVNDSGIAQCLQAATGEQLWQQRIGGQHSASPILADGRVYFLSDGGETTVIEAGRTFKLVAKNNLGEKCQASPAVSRRQIFIRAERHLYCIGAQAGQ